MKNRCKINGYIHVFHLHVKFQRKIKERINQKRNNILKYPDSTNIKETTMSPKGKNTQGRFFNINNRR